MSSILTGSEPKAYLVTLFWKLIRRKLYEVADRYWQERMPNQILLSIIRVNGKWGIEDTEMNMAALQPEVVISESLRKT